MSRRTMANFWPLALLALLLLAASRGDASLDRFLFRRQSSDVEKEATTPRSQLQRDEEPARLYPDLPQPAGGQAGFNAPGAFGLSPFNQPPTPFVPFGGPQMPNRFTDPRFQPRPMSSADRAQSLTFTNGLGRRLLSMVGIQMPEANSTSGITTRSDRPEGEAMNQPQDPMRVLQNSTVLSQLNRGVQSIYGSLSKMYNETVQQQLALLQDKFKKESENSTNPWQQRMAQQVPQFFKSMAARVDGAQENLNRIWRDVVSASNGTMNWTQPLISPNGQPRTLFGSFDQFLNDGNQMFPQSNNFLSSFNRHFGFGGPNGDETNPSERQAQPGEASGNNLGAQLRYFWHNQVQPQIGVVRGQMSRVWRDLTSSGVLAPEPMVRARQGPGLGSAPTNGDSNSSSSDLVDNILKEVDVASSDFSLVEPKSDSNNVNNQQAAGRKQQSMLSSQMQNGITNMQRELNQLWMGLSRSLQNAVSSVRQTLNPRPQFGMIEPSPSSDSRRVAEIDPAENEIDGKIKDLSKLQRDADTVYSVLQQQQMAQQPQRPSIGDRFRNYFGNMNFGPIDELPSRVSDSVNRFGGVVTDLWNQIPERWDNFMQGATQRQPQLGDRRRDGNEPANGRLSSPASTSSTTTERSS